MKPTNMIEKVKELSKLVSRRQAIIDRQQENWNHALLERLEIESDMLKEVNWMLSALGKIREGDANEIDYAIQELERILGHNNVAETTEVLHRYHELASMIEDEYAT